MASILQSLGKTVTAGFVLLVAIIIVVSAASHQTALITLDYVWWTFLFRWLHVLSGVMWIGLLWYFNFVQIPSMPKIPDEQKPAIGKVIAPAALFWFRWAALSTLVTGLILAYLNGYLASAVVIGLNGEFGGRATAIGIGMWLGAIMAFNVWFVIWPNQKKALGIVEASADAKKAAARTAMLFSRTNTMLSIPMLYAMVSAQNLF
ncbi:MAG: urate hydroxylase PuuD [Alphaproteobacteria bacterium]|nr:urate hydroxylase PuuD [Alphaproteobacteria bacterium]